ncbi:PAS domain-containing sensor histidine kinase [Clostridium sp. NSJ-6]|uniref:histidine kinase n=1 Tax=Clostridium hominis TaxID=2763036 RepID=A0ABR7DI92_9CLOT|nr:PAS domain-containing sensor histidine kinase [Clostridium hominis]MBC5631078.1 PAS domain-containing sensor histidine kinase [Clostridium hominis]MDU2671159.1 PAS domain-containing sensor histidine kinase [Clostridium sp.]
MKQECLRKGQKTWDIINILSIIIFLFFTSIVIKGISDKYFIEYMCKTITSMFYIVLMIYSISRMKYKYNSIFSEDNEDDFYLKISIGCGFLALITIIKSAIFYSTYTNNISFDLISNKTIFINTIYYILQIILIGATLNNFKENFKYFIIIFIVGILINFVFMEIIELNVGSWGYSIRSMLLVCGFIFLIILLYKEKERFDDDSYKGILVYLSLKVVYLLSMYFKKYDFFDLRFYLFTLIYIVGEYSFLKVLISNTLINTEKNLNEKLHYMVSWYEGIFENMPDAVTIRKNDEIIYINDSYQNFFNIKNKNDVIGKSIFDIVDKGSYERIKEKDTILSNDSILKPRRNIYTINDITIECEEIGVKLKDTYNDLYLFILRDIKYRKDYENMILKLKQKEDDEKLKNQFFTNISHEFKTPVNVIYSAMQMQEKYIDDGNLVGCRKYTSSIRQNCFRLIKLINNILDINKIESGYYSPTKKIVNIVEKVEDITKSIIDYASFKGIEVIFDTVEEEIFCSCDEDSIERIVLNLISNAIKYNEHGGLLYVNIEKAEDKVAIFFKDNGCGIDKDRVDTIFNRFERGDTTLYRKAEGSGIGLNLVKSMVEINNGNISIESEVGKGTTVRVELPVVKCDVEDYYKLQDEFTFENTLVPKVEIEFSDIYF